MDRRIKPGHDAALKIQGPKFSSCECRIRAFRYLLILGWCAWKHSCHTFRIDVEGQECQWLAAWVPPLMHEGVGFIDQGTRGSCRRRAVDCVGASAGDYIVQSRS